MSRWPGAFPSACADKARGASSGADLQPDWPYRSKASAAAPLSLDLMYGHFLAIHLNRSKASAAAPPPVDLNRLKALAAAPPLLHLRLRNLDGGYRPPVVLGRGNALCNRALPPRCTPPRTGINKRRPIDTSQSDSVMLGGGGRACGGAAAAEARGGGSGGAAKCTHSH
jgi:hypothetical protein